MTPLLSMLNSGLDPRSSKVYKKCFYPEKLENILVYLNLNCYSYVEELFVHCILKIIPIFHLLNFVPYTW